MSGEMTEIPADIGDADVVAWCAAQQRPDPPYAYIPPAADSDSDTQRKRRTPRAKRQKKRPEPLATRLERLSRCDNGHLAIRGRAEYALRLREAGQKWKEIGQALGGVSDERARQLAHEGEQYRYRARTPYGLGAASTDDALRVYLAALEDQFSELR